MALPKLPSLSVKEKAYIDELERQCNCKVKREFDPRVSKVNPESEYNEGHYSVTFDSVPCPILSNKDSLKVVSRQIAKKLYKEILGEDFDYKYKEITVIFNCQTSSSSSKSEGYDFKIEKLEK